MWWSSRKYAIVCVSYITLRCLPVLWFLQFYLNSAKACGLQAMILKFMTGGLTTVQNYDTLRKDIWPLQNVIIKSCPPFLRSHDHLSGPWRLFYIYDWLQCSAAMWYTVCDLFIFCWFLEKPPIWGIGLYVQPHTLLTRRVVWTYNHVICWMTTIKRSIKLALITYLDHHDLWSKFWPQLWL